MVIMPTYKISGVEIPNEELHFAYITHKLRNEYGFIESSKKNIPVNNKPYSWTLPLTNQNVSDISGTGYYIRIEDFT